MPSIKRDTSSFFISDDEGFIQQPVNRYQAIIGSTLQTMENQQPLSKVNEVNDKIIEIDLFVITGK